MNHSTTSEQTSGNSENLLPVYRVRGGGHEATVRGRARAVRRAKALSGARRDAILVDRADRKETILYKGGTVHSYRLETR